MKKLFSAVKTIAHIHDGSSFCSSLCIFYLVYFDIFCFLNHRQCSKNAAGRFLDCTDLLVYFFVKTSMGNYEKLSFYSF